MWSDSSLLLPNGPTVRTKSLKSVRVIVSEPQGLSILAKTALQGGLCSAGTVCDTHEYELGGCACCNAVTHLQALHARKCTPFSVCRAPVKEHITKPLNSVHWFQVGCSTCNVTPNSGYSQGTSAIQEKVQSSGTHSSHVVIRVGTGVMGSCCVVSGNFLIGYSGCIQNRTSISHRRTVHRSGRGNRWLARRCSIDHG